MKDLKIYFAIACALLLVYLIAEYNRPSPINWSTSLYYKDKIPFGTTVLYNRLNDIYPGATVTNTNKSIYSLFTDTALQAGNYLIIAQSVKLTKDDYKALIKYISAGSSVFISSFDWNGYIVDSLKLETGNEYAKTTNGVNFTNDKVKTSGAYRFDKSTSSQYFSGFDTLRATVIGQSDSGKANYISFKFGKGKLYLFANPQLLTNYTLLKPDGANYAAKVLSYLPQANTVYWDQYQNHDIAQDQSPMRVFFSRPNLQWAYYLSLVSLLLFIIYEAKRRQRIIPVIDPLKNTTVEFVSVVGKVYYEQRDNSNIAIKKIVYFAEHLRNTFGLKTGTYNQDFLTAFINKTGVESGLAKELVNHINYLQNQARVTDHELIVLNQLIEKFYIQSGSYGK